MFLELSNDINNVLFGQILPLVFFYQTFGNLLPGGNCSRQLSPFLHQEVAT